MRNIFTRLGFNKAEITNFKLGYVTGGFLFSPFIVNEHCKIFFHQHHYAEPLICGGMIVLWPISTPLLYIDCLQDVVKEYCFEKD